MSEFDWNNMEPGEKVVTEARSTAVYRNTEGDVVIRQQASWPDEQEDPVIIIPSYRVQALIERLETMLADPNTRE